MATGSATGEHAPAIRNLSVAGLLAPVEGAWTVTQAGYAVLELEGPSGGDGGGATDAAGDLKAKIRDWFMN